jgi:hypothetical protein
MVSVINFLYCTVIALHCCFVCEATIVVVITFTNKCIYRTTNCTQVLKIPVGVHLLVNGIDCKNNARSEQYQILYLCLHHGTQCLSTD